MSYSNIEGSTTTYTVQLQSLKTNTTSHDIMEFKYSDGGQVQIKMKPAVEPKKIMKPVIFDVL